MYALRIPKSRSPVHPVLVHTDGRPEVTLECLHVSMIGSKCGLFMYDGSLYVFIIIGVSKHSKCLLYKISDDGKTCTMLSGHGLRKVKEVVCPCVHDIYVQDGVVQIQHGSHQYTINMDDSYTITRLDNIFGITPSVDGKLRTCIIEHASELTICKTTGADVLVTLPQSHLVNSIIIADMGIVYIYLVHQRITIWPDGRYTVDPTNMRKVTVCGTVHVGMRAGSKDIVMWNPHDNTTYRMPLGDNGLYYRISF